MKISRSVAGRLRLVATATAGVVAGHFVGYRLVFPGSPQRHAILVETGHGYIPTVSRVAAMLAVVAGAAWLARGFEHARAGGGEVPTRVAIAAPLATMQVAAFVGLEVLERIVSGVPLHHLLLPVLIVGTIAQVAIAAAGAAIVVALYRGGRRLGRTGRPASAEGSPPPWMSARKATPVTSDIPTPTSIRGPPALLLDAS